MNTFLPTSVFVRYGAAILAGSIFTLAAHAAVRYVDPRSLSPAAPYTSWETAAKTIQQAIDASSSGDEVLVTNGVYAAGATSVGASILNRVTVNKPITVRSVNGPEVTVIRGVGPAQGGTIVRCLYIGPGATVSGFTLTNGANGVFCASTDSVLTNCIVAGNKAAYSSDGSILYERGVAVRGGSAWNCRFTANDGFSVIDSSTIHSASVFGNSASTVFNSCTVYSTFIVSNTASTMVTDCSLFLSTLSSNQGDGALRSSLENSFIRNHTGAGARQSQLKNCTLEGNLMGGATTGSILEGCRLLSNRSPLGGAGALESYLTNCVVAWNVSDTLGAGLAGGAAQNCTIVGNEPMGFTGTELVNCIVTHNTPVNYPSGASMRYSCSNPRPSGPGNIDADPRLMTLFHLSSDSPCIGKGSSLYAFGVDLDGDAWLKPPAMGADQPVTNGLLGDIQLKLRASHHLVAAGYPIELSAYSSSALRSLVWDFADGQTVTNAGFVTHAWGTAGTYRVKVTGSNDAFPEGVSDYVDIEVVQSESFVDANSANPVPPYSSWSTAARTLQAGVSVSEHIPGRKVWVAAGVYDAGGGEPADGSTLPSFRVSLNNRVHLKSVAGPARTVIKGAPAPSGGPWYGGTLCVKISEGSTVEGFTISEGSGYGTGGVEGNGIVLNCVVTKNHGGATGAGKLIIRNSVIKENFDDGLNRRPAVVGAELYNCTITRNSTIGAFHCRLYNCISYFNSPSNLDGESSAAWNSCVTPRPQTGSGNITLNPLFLTVSHLSSNSPCARAGSPSFSQGVDIDGEPWLSPPSMGADQVTSTSDSGELHLFLSASAPSVVVGRNLELRVDSIGSLKSWRLDFGDGSQVTNSQPVTHSWSKHGTYVLTLTGVSDREPQEQSVTLSISVTEGIHYVNPSSPAPSYPYDSWETAGRSIQEVVNSILEPGHTVVVTNGVYRTGSAWVYSNGVYSTNRVVLTNGITLRSANGPFHTIIQGGRSPDRGGVFLSEGNTLEGFTVEAGMSELGGVVCDGKARVSNCIVRHNTGRGVVGIKDGSSAVLENCAVYGNLGDGVHNASLRQCTVVDNAGVGVSGAQVFNSIVYDNRGGIAWNHNHLDSTFLFSCTDPLPSGLGNISSPPRLASLIRLATDSPCIGAGRADYSKGRDLDGESWPNPPCMGVDQIGGIPRPEVLPIRIIRQASTVNTNYPLRFAADTGAWIDTSIWEFGDGVSVTNAAVVSHAWSSPGSYSVRVTAYGSPFPQGLTAVTNVVVVAQSFYVNPLNPLPSSPFNSWARAANTIQDAVDASQVLGRIIWVTNGIYNTGLRVLAGAVNRVAISNGAVVRSLNGPAVTVIDGGRNGRGVALLDGARLSGFTVKQGWESLGGGVGSDGSGVIENCVVAENASKSFFLSNVRGGGGAYNAVIRNSILLRNEALSQAGGGANSCLIYNCLISSNSANYGGGVAHCLLRACTVAGNSFPLSFDELSGAGAFRSVLESSILMFNRNDNHSGCSFRYSCVSPLPSAGFGNFNRDPKFIGQASGDYQLAADSPCINAGSTLNLGRSADLLGAPRVVAGRMDVGAYEFQSPLSSVSHAWLLSFNLPIDGSADDQDVDLDGVTNLMEWKTGTSPKDPLSKFELLPSVLTTEGLRLRWKGSLGWRYWVYRSDSLGQEGDFKQISGAISGKNGVLEFLDSMPPNDFARALFYQIETAPEE